MVVKQRTSLSHQQVRRFYKTEIKRRRGQAWLRVQIGHVFYCFLLMSSTPKKSHWTLASSSIFLFLSPLTPVQLKPEVKEERSKNPKRLHSDLDSDEDLETTKDQGWTKKILLYSCLCFVSATFEFYFLFLFKRKCKNKGKKNRRALSLQNFFHSDGSCLLSNSKQFSNFHFFF